MTHSFILVLLGRIPGPLASLPAKAADGIAGVGVRASRKGTWRDLQNREAGHLQYSSSQRTPLPHFRPRHAAMSDTFVCWEKSYAPRLFFEFQDIPTMKVTVEIPEKDLRDIIRFS